MTSTVLDEQFPKLQALITQGHDLTVTGHTKGKFHAAVYRGPLHGPESQHWIGSSVAEAIAGLERYVDEHEAVRVEAPATPTSPDNVLAREAIVTYEWVTTQQHVSLTDQTPICSSFLFDWWVKEGWEVVSVTAFPPVTASYMCRAVGVLRRPMVEKQL